MLRLEKSLAAMGRGKDWAERESLLLRDGNRRGRIVHRRQHLGGTPLPAGGFVLHKDRAYNVDIAPNVFIGNGTHEITPERERIADIELSKDVAVGDGCWLCANSAILPGVSVGGKCVVAAGAVVTKSFAGNCLLAGVPAEVKKKL